MISILKQSTLFVILIVCLYFLVDLFIFPMYTRHGDEFELVDFTEKTYESVIELATENELQIILKDSTFSSLHEAGIVIAQEPKAFSLVKSDRRIYVTLSLGDKPIKVPKLQGSSLSNSTFLLEAQNLVLGDVMKKFSSIYPSGVVMAQSKPVNSLVLAGDTINITVSIGEDVKSLPIDNYIGMTFQKAKKLAAKRGLTVLRIEGEELAEYVPGTVVDQSIVAGTVLENENNEITFTISQ